MVSFGDIRAPVRKTIYWRIGNEIWCAEAEFSNGGFHKILETVKRIDNPAGELFLDPVCNLNQLRYCDG